MIRQDAWGARAAAAGTAWGGYLERYRGHATPEPRIDDATHDEWQRFMRRDCLLLASAIGRHMRLPVGKLRKGDQLAHGFVILPSHDGVPDRWACLDWSGVRPLKQIRDDLRDAWGRLEFDPDISPVLLAKSEASGLLKIARTRPHLAQAMRIGWPRVSTVALRGFRLRYLDVLDLHVPQRRRDVIDVR